jgi:hypothetical protein
LFYVAAGFIGDVSIPFIDFIKKDYKIYEPEEILNNFKMIDHIHISEYNLSELKNIEFHIKFSEKLKELNYNGFVIFEIFKNENINKNIKEFYEIYR